MKFSQSSSKQHPKRGEYVRRNRTAEVMKLKIQSYQFKIYFKTNAPQEKKQCCVEFRLSFGLEIRAPLT